MTKKYQLAPSVLHTIAKEVDVSHDLTLESNKTIAELLDEEKNKEISKEDKKDQN